MSWRANLVVEEAGAPGENDWPWASKWSTLSLAAASRVHPFCNLQSRVRTHAVLVIGWYELLGNPTHWATRALRKKLREENDYYYKHQSHLSLSCFTHSLEIMDTIDMIWDFLDVT